MSRKLVSLSPDLRRLRDEGYEVDIVAGHLVVTSVPYVSPSGQVAQGVLVSPLELAGEIAARPSDHVIWFAGEQPCDQTGVPLPGLQNSEERREISQGLVVDRSFSNKPPEGFENYYDKVTNYVLIISAHAQAIEPASSARTYKAIQTPESDEPFRYLDTNASRAGISQIVDKLRGLNIAIVGVGGTGSYVLDFAVKTPVAKVHIYDGDHFLTHNAFRAPGAASLEVLNGRPKKVHYLRDIYSSIHKGVVAHDYWINDVTAQELSGLDFVFLCVDEERAKRAAIEALLAARVPFVDVGIGVNLIDGALSGSLRTTLATATKSDHLAQRVSLAEEGVKDEYSANIQIAELNALNAALAVIKWKKYFGYYHDLEHEHNAVYDINVNKLINDDLGT